MSAELRSPAGRRGHGAQEHSSHQPGSSPSGSKPGSPGHVAAEESVRHQPSRELDEEAQRSVVGAPAPAGKGRKLVRIALWTFQIGLALGLGYWLASARAGREERIDLPAAALEPAGKGEAVAVTIAPVERRHIERAIDAVGTLHGYDELTLKTKISGRVARIHHDFADRVEPGELLVEIDPTDSLLAVEQAKRSLNSELAKWGFQDVPAANADLTQLPTVVAAKVRLDWSNSQLSRLGTLQTRGSATAEELEQARTNALVAQSDYANQLLLARAGAANAQLKKSELAIAEQQLRETKVYVPVREAADDALKGARYTITDRYVTEGAWLAAGSDLFRLVIDETLKLRLSIPEKHASAVRIGQRVEVSTLTAAEPVVGRVTRIGPSVDPQTRTFQIEAEVPNQDGGLKTGGFAKARVIVTNESSAETVPTAALVTFAGVHKVFVLRGDRVVEHRVKLGEQTPEWIEIVDANIPENAQVIVSGQSRLADGSLVRLRETEEKPVSSSAVKYSGEQTDQQQAGAEQSNAGSNGAR
jgi:RND family efflux transporter MFP subunit